MQITFDDFGDIQIQPPVVPSVARKPSVSAPAATSSTSQDQNQRQENQARQQATPTLSFQNALAAQEAGSDRIQERDAPFSFQEPDVPVSAVSAYEQTLSQSATAGETPIPGFVTLSPAPEQASVNTQSAAAAPNDAFIKAAAAYTDRVLETTDFAQPGDTLRFNA